MHDNWNKVVVVVVSVIAFVPYLFDFLLNQPLNQHLHQVDLKTGTWEEMPGMCKRECRFLSRVEGRG